MSPAVPAGPAQRGGRRGRAGGAVAVALTALAGAWVWASGELAGWLASGRWPKVPLGALPEVLARLPSHLSDPRLAWPTPASALLPPAGLLGAVAGALVAAALVGVWTAWRALGRLSGARLRLVAGPAPGPPGRGRPGARWASARDLRRLAVGRRDGEGRLVIGRVGRVLVAAESRHSVLVVGPTQSGKTSGLAIPALLEWPGPAIATSVKDDLATATLGWRSLLGTCWVFDPTAGSGMAGAGWSPLSACDSWSGAQRMASWLVEATPARSGMADAAFWYAAAAKQLAPLLLAARLAGLSMAEVVRWTNAGCFEEPAAALEAAEETEAAVALYACAARDERIRSSVTTTLETVLAPFEDPVVADATACTEVDLDALISAPHTLYLCGPSHEQARVQGLFAALVSSALAAAAARAAAGGRPLDPPLLVVLDEVANIAPVRDLDSLASTGAGMGIQLVTVCQDLAQLSARFGAERARTIANNHRAKVVLSGVADLSTLDLLSGLVGEQVVREYSFTEDLSDGRRSRSSAASTRRLAPPDELRRIPPGEGVLVYGHLPPARLRLRYWHRDRRLRARAQLAAAQARPELAAAPGSSSAGRRPRLASSAADDAQG